MMPDISASDFAEQLTARLREIDEKAAKIKTQMAPLIQERDQARVAGNDSAAIALKHQLNVLQERLEELEYSKGAAQAKLRVYDQKENVSEAAKVRDKANAFWEEGRGLIDEFVKMQSRARTIYGKALDLESKISALGNEHLRLVGRDMRGPPSITGTVYQLGAFAAGNVQAVKPLEPWQYVSDEELKAAHKEELDKKLKAHEERIKIAEEHAPDCPNCARGDRQTKLIVDRRSGHTNAPGQAGRGHNAHHWGLVCPKCGAILTTAIPETKVTGI